MLKQDGEKEVVYQGQPAAFGRLCVETAVDSKMKEKDITSRLRAAVCLNIIIFDRWIIF